MLQELINHLPSPLSLFKMDLFSRKVMQSRKQFPLALISHSSLANMSGIWGINCYEGPGGGLLTIFSVHIDDVRKEVSAVSAAEEGEPRLSHELPQISYKPNKA